MARHPDFDRIFDEFIKYWGKDEGEQEYQAWIKALNLDETKPYAFSQREKFSFLKPMLARLKEDTENVYYRVLVGFPLTSMNNNLYTRSKLAAAASSLVDAFDCNINHLPGHNLPGVRYIAAKFEDGAVEAVLKVPKSVRCAVDLTRHMYDIGEGKPLYELIDEGIFYNQSLEADEEGGFHFTGSALLTKDVLPGIPLSKIMPLEGLQLSETYSVRIPTFEKVVSEALSASQKLKGKTLKIQVKGLSKMSEETPSCPVGQHWDAAKNACVPDEEPGASNCNFSGSEADYPWDQCIADMKAQGHDDDSAAKICAAIKNSTVSHAMLYKLAKTPAEARKLVAERMTKDPLFAYLANEVERLKTSQNAQVISSLNVAKARAESELENLKLKTAAQIESIKNESAAAVKGAELKAAKAEENYIEESKRRQKAENQVEMLEKTVEKLERQVTENNKSTITDGARIKDLERRLQDAVEKLEQVKAENEKLADANAKTDEKYREMLKKNGELNKELIQTSEKLLETSERAEKLDVDLKKAKRLAKITVNM